MTLYRETGHLSYACPKNVLGEREPPKKKEKKKRKKIIELEEEIEEVEESEDEEDPALDSLSQAIAFQKKNLHLPTSLFPERTPPKKGRKVVYSSMQAKIEEDQQIWKPSAREPSTSDDSKRPTIKKSAHFSDEEELSD